MEPRPLLTIVDPGKTADRPQPVASLLAAAAGAEAAQDASAVVVVIFKAGRIMVSGRATPEQLALAGAHLSARSIVP